ncbi:MAG TPA: amidohydrolase family protein, partial [Candidatus Syntrophosphaera sp.]|nr:amidohydrolase family protein [Candidatus Syntrophosphaera sp.]
MNKSIDLLLQGGTILTLDSGLRVLEGQAIAIDQGQILDIFDPREKSYQARRTLDTSNCIVMPGLINAHTHLPMSYFRGLADDLPLQTWLHDFIWPLEA